MPKVGQVDFPEDWTKFVQAYSNFDQIPEELRTELAAFETPRDLYCAMKRNSQAWQLQSATAAWKAFYTAPARLAKLERVLVEVCEGKEGQNDSEVQGNEMGGGKGRPGECGHNKSGKG